MAIIEGGVSGALVGVGAESNSPLHAVLKALPHGSLGHYRTGIKLTMATTQAANSRLFEIRNTTTNLLVLTRCFVMVSPAGTITTPYVGEIGLFRLTGFTAVDTTNTVTPTTSVKRTSMAAYPGGAAVRHNTVAGAAAGMTGGTLTKDANMLGSLLFNATTFGAGTVPISREFVDDENGTHPLVLAQNEGFELENVVVGSGTANVVHVMINCSWAEVTAY
jgi:hypothetical protein